MKNKNRLLPGFLTLLRIAIGWHFLYEGLVKIFNPAWSAKSFLEGSRWIFGDLFRWLASGDNSLWIINNANAYGLTLIGVALILGLFVRLASWSGILLLFIYYLAYPPFGGFSYGAPAEGAYLIVNKNLIELLVLLVLAFTELDNTYRLHTLLRKKDITKSIKESTPEKIPVVSDKNSRRELLKGLIGIPVLAGFGGAFLKNLHDIGPDAVSGATVKVNYKQLGDIKGDKLPEGKIGNLSISRMIMGCNLIIGMAHARDLQYVNRLFKAYNTEQRVLETYRLAEMAGINTTFMVSSMYRVLNKYKKIYGGNMQSFCQCMIKEDDFYGDIDRAIDRGATTIYIQGGEGDRYVKAGKIEMLSKAIEYIKKEGYLAGIGAHSLEVVKACEKEGIPVDYYVKTFHHDKYWSASPQEFRVEYSPEGERQEDHNLYHDNIWDLFPSKTADFMKQVNKPWIAFKVLSAGAILPQQGFRFAFENGADFICVGMFDFQVVENVNTAVEILGSLKKRERAWHS